MQTSISIEHLSKRFRLTNREYYATIRDRIAGMFRRRVQSAEARELWALRDINLEVPAGEALGLIGHNGAGKSTLLKILTRITEPTEGRALLRGRVASLLEVGTGFHPELTGRENIFLNGAILGMTRAEIRQNFDAIVAFAEIEQFLDMPVKRYSSGMYVRLAFAVAAHLTPEILLVDEVLAVGDLDFQRRCLGRMDEVARSGRTVVFVSHNLDAIERLCSKALLLSRGRVEKYGDARSVISYYVSKRQGVSSFDASTFGDRTGTGRAFITRVEILSQDGTRPMDSIAMDDSFRVRIHYEVPSQQRLTNPAIGFGLLSSRDERIFMTSTADVGRTIEFLEGEGSFDCVVPYINAVPGTYHFELWISDPDDRQHGMADHLRMVGSIEIVPGERFQGNVAQLTSPDRGRVYIGCQWESSEAIG